MYEEDTRRIEERLGFDKDSIRVVGVEERDKKGISPNIIESLYSHYSIHGDVDIEVIKEGKVNKYVVYVVLEEELSENLV